MQIIIGMALAVGFMSLGWCARGEVQGVPEFRESAPVQVASNEFTDMVSRLTDGATERMAQPLPVKIKGLK